ncbi:MAG TPA: condensation domain-containing protein, partial [Candidatus Angelobacter sp.]|nr:condensation domain-containing protein [Candidatus Angelobacter sp.]
PDTIAYHFQARIRIRGALDVAALEGALAVIIERHESLRTVFVEHDGAPYQIIQAPWRPSLPVVDLSGLPDSMRGGYVDVLIDAELRKRIDVSKLPLVRWLLIREAPDLHVLLHVEHHLTHDGWSFRLFVRELAALYNARKRPGFDPGLAQPRQYREFCRDEREWLDGPEGRSERAWWCERLTGWPAYGNSITPGVAERRAAPTFLGHSISIPIPPAVLGSAVELAMTERATLFESMVAVFAAVVRERSGSDRIIIGTGVANREDVGTESIIGMLVNAVPLRFQRSGSLRERLEEARQEVREACGHGRTPLSIMVQDLRPDRLTKALPFLQTTFSFQNSMSRELSFDGLEVDITEALSNGTAKFDLNVIVMFDDEANLRRGGRMVVEFAHDVGSEAEIAAFCDSYLETLGSWAARPLLTLGQLRAGGEDAAVPDDLTYWRRRFADLADAHLLGRAYRNARPSGCRARLDRQIPPGLPETHLLAAYALLLSRHTSCADVLFGYVPEGRADSLPVRLRVDETQSLGTFRGEVEAAVQGALAHGAPGLAAISDVLLGTREESQALLETAFAVGRSLQAQAVELAWMVIRGDRADTIVLDWDEGRFERAAIERLSDHFARLLEAGAEAPMRDAPMMSPEEVSTILAWSRGPTPDYPERTVHGQFEFQATARPHAIALRCEGRDVTYGELDRRANRLAAALRARGVEKGAAVGVIAARTPDVIAALLGILKAGAAYVPIESDYPAERQRLIAAESRLSVVLADAPQVAVTGEGVDVLAIGALLADAPDRPAIETDAGPDDRCYVLFTSGSTGTPKGVASTHRAVVRLVCNTNYVEISNADRFLRFAP